MTPEGPQHPGYEPEDGPDAGGPAPYGTNCPRFGEELPRRRSDARQGSNETWPASEAWQSGPQSDPQSAAPSGPPSGT